MSTAPPFRAELRMPEKTAEEMVDMRNLGVRYRHANNAKMERYGDLAPEVGFVDCHEKRICLAIQNRGYCLILDDRAWTELRNERDRAAVPCGDGLLQTSAKKLLIKDNHCDAQAAMSGRVASRCRAATSIACRSASRVILPP